MAALGIERTPGNPGPTDNPLNIVRFKKSQQDRLQVIIDDLDGIVIGRMNFDGARTLPEFEFAPNVVSSYIKFMEALKKDVRI